MRLAQNWKKQNPDGLLVTYINSDVRLKAMSDFVSTSRNTDKIIAYAAKNFPGREILVLPDKFLGFVMKARALEILEKEGIKVSPDLIEIYQQSFGGFNACCYVHEQLGPDAIDIAIMKNPEKPLTAIVGGVKVETKAALINKVSEKADYVLVGGLISKEIRKKDIYINYPRKIIGPIDETGGGKDIGPKTIKLFNQKILLAKTIFFNGVLGQIEDKRYAKGTEEILKTIVKSGAFSVIGGGDTVEFVNLLGLDSKFNHISTGGGAMIAFLAGEKLPGIEALK